MVPGELGLVLCHSLEAFPVASVGEQGLPPIAAITAATTAAATTATRPSCRPWKPAPLPPLWSPSTALAAGTAGLGRAAQVAGGRTPAAQRRCTRQRNRAWRQERVRGGSDSAQGCGDGGVADGPGGGCRSAGCTDLPASGAVGCCAGAAVSRAATHRCARGPGGGGRASACRP